MGWLDNLMIREEPEAVTTELEGAMLDEVTAGDLIVDDINSGAYMSRSRAMAIPAFAAAVDTISGTVSSLPIKLYRRDGEKVEEVRDDRRITLLNGDTGDTLTGPEMIKAMVEDYYCSRNGGNMYVHRPYKYRNDVESLHYVKCEEVAPLVNKVYDPIFKECCYLIGSKTYMPWDVVRVLRSTRNGCYGQSIIDESTQALAVAYQTMVFEHSLVKRGGSKRGFLSAPRKLGAKALRSLREAWRKFYASGDSNVVIMNDGLTFQEATATSTEMQLNENKKTNSDDIYGLFKMPPEIIRAGSTRDASKGARDNYLRHCIMPILREFVAALNRSLLTEEEKACMTFSFDLSEFTKADMKERWESWKVAKEGGFMGVDEVRAEENLPPLGIDYISMGLQDVLFDPKTHRIIVPNMGTVIDLDNLKPGKPPTDGEGGDQDEDKDPR